MEWKNLPIEIQNRILDCQEEQGNPRDESVFKRRIDANINMGGFDWLKTKEGSPFWANVLWVGDIDVFLKEYPKIINQKQITDYSQLIINEYYWVKMGDKWFPALYKFNGHFVINELAIKAESIKLENIEICKHD